MKYASRVFQKVVAAVLIVVLALTPVLSVPTSVYAAEFEGDTSYSSSKIGFVAYTSELNLRSGPSTSYDVVKVLELGNQVTVIGENGSYYKTADGYVSKSYIQFKNSNDTLYTSAQMAVVTSIDVLNVRKTASASAKVVDTLKSMTKIPVYGTNGKFYRVSKGYVSKDYISFVNSGDSFYSAIKNGTVKAEGGLNVRSTPSTSAKVVTVLKNGSTVKILGTNGSFYKVTNGYVAKSYIKLGTAASSSGDVLYSTAKTGIVNATGGLHVRATASLSGKIVTTLKDGSSVKLLGTNGNFYKVSNGYVSKSYITIGSTSNNGDKIYSSAKQGKVSSSGARLNVRKTASSSGTVVGYLVDGSSVKILGENGDFYKISSGYVMKKYVKIVSSSSSSSSITVSNTVKANGGLNIRSGPGSSYSVTGSYANGTKITIKSAVSGWYKTSKGWVSANYVTTKTASATATVNVRLTGSTSAKIVKTIKSGTKVKVLAVSNGWVLTDQGGWISASYLKQ